MNSLETILTAIQDAKVIPESHTQGHYIPIDLSVDSPDLLGVNIENSNDFENFINKYLDKNDSKVAYGGYNEERNLYKRSENFNVEAYDERNIHIGIDLWIEAGTTILAALEGEIHSFNNNLGLGDYGPTIILKHRIEDHVFYTLYGHLSVESITDIETGTVFKKGQAFATLGSALVNGDYAPHLHFQIIKDLDFNYGDFPGVCSKTRQKYYLENCPDPNLLLKLPSQS